MPLTAAQKLVLFPSVVRYLLLDRFGGELAAGAVNGTPAEPGPGTRVVTDTNSKLSITGGVASFATGGAGAGNPGLWYPQLTRVVGKTLLIQVIPNAGANAGAMTGWDNNQTGAQTDRFEFLNGSLRVALNSGTAVAVGTFTDGQTYSLALVQRNPGVYFFAKGGSQYPAWTLIFASDLGVADQYPSVVAGGIASVFTADNIRVPTALYTVPVLAYDTFTRANGALGNSETSGPDAQGVAARAWTGATWAVSSNAAVNTPAQGADVVVNGGFATDSDWTKGTGWTISGGKATHAAGTQSTLSQNVTAGWYLVTYTISGRTAGILTLNSNAGASSKAANGTATAVILGSSVAFGATDTFDGSIDDVSAKPLTPAELYAYLSASAADVVVDVNVTGPTINTSIPAGIILNADSTSNPQNFVVAYLDGGPGPTVRLDKYVAGVRTAVTSAAVTYSAGAVLRVIKSGTSYSLFYNGAAVGSTSTISDAGIVDNTLHGLFSTSASNSLDNFTVWPRGTGGEYGGLDAY